jgi:HAD superfamily phosphatase
LSGEYEETWLDSGVVMVRKEWATAFPRVDAVIFDCDGVLIDVRESYTRAITESVAYFTRELFGADFPETPALMELLHSFKMSGGFNNEWDIAYALLLHLFTRLSKTLRGRFVERLHRSEGTPPFMRFQLAKEVFKGQLSPRERDDLLDLADAFALARKADSTGIPSIERELETRPESKAIFEATKKFLAYPGRVGESPLTTVFEEIFCGVNLFQEQYGIQPQFYWGNGLINEEKTIISWKILEELASLMGRHNFGIATGRPYLLARHTLGKILEGFNRKATVFIEDVVEEERRERRKGVEVDLTKPDPFSLLRSAEGLQPFHTAAFVGDSAEDVMMAKQAWRRNGRFLAVGVYSTSRFKEDLISNFVRLKADAILPSINELAGLLKRMR